MELAIARAPFAAALASAAAVADQKTTMPILANALLRTDGQRIGIAATDMALTVSVALDASVSKGGSCTTPARELHAFVKALSCEMVTLTVRGTTLIVRGGKAMCELPILPAGDFPKLPDHRELKMVEMPAATLREMLAKTCYAGAIGSSRPYLGGVHLESKNGKAIAEASDGHRAAQIRRGLMIDLPSMLLPLNGAAEIQRVLADAEKVGLAAHGQHLFVACGDVVLAVKMVEQRFPDLEGMLPKRSDSGTVNRAELLDAFRRVGLFADLRGGGKNDKSVSSGGGVKVTLRKGAIELLAQQVDGSKGEDEVAVEYAGEVLTFGLNGRYAIEALESITDDKLVFQILKGDNDPVSFWPANDPAHRVVVLKMRLEK